MGIMYGIFIKHDLKQHQLHCYLVMLYIFCGLICSPYCVSRVGSPCKLLFSIVVYSANSARPCICSNVFTQLLFRYLFLKCIFQWQSIVLMIKLFQPFLRKF